MQLSAKQLASLREALQAVPDSRGQRGLRCPLATVLTIELGSRLRPQTQRYHAPGI